MVLTRVIVAIALFLGLSVGVLAQELVSTCEETLGKAEDEFSVGRFFGIPVILNDCLSQFSRDQRFRAYLLLAQTYLLIDDQQKAEQSYIEVLKADPEFVPNEQTESIDIVNLSKKFTSTAIFTPHAKAGLVLALPRVVRYSEAYGTSVEVDNIFNPGWNVGAGIEWNVTRNWGVGSELFISYKAFRQTRAGIFGQDVVDRRSQQWWIDIPLYLRYSDNLGKWRPFGYAGYSFNFLLLSRNLYEFTDFTSSGGGDGEAPFQVPNSGPAVNVRPKQHMVNRSFIMGAGIKYKFGRDFLMAELRYVGGLNILQRQDRLYYDDTEGLTLDPTPTRYAYVSDFFRLDNLIFNVGYVRPLYQPRKIKSGGIFSFLKRGGKK
jgi:hypothetical protein